MAAQVHDITGHCLCGAVSIRVSGSHDPRPGACHCRMCQRWSGAVFMCFQANAEAVHADGPIQRYASSDFAERAFCRHCGSHLWMRDTNTDQEPYELMPGLFDAVLKQPLRSEIYVDCAMTAVQLSGDHPRATRIDYEQRNPHVDEGESE